MLIEIYLTKVTQANVPNTVLAWIISCSLPMQPTNLSRLQIQYGISIGSCRNKGKKCIFSVYRLEFGLFITNYDFQITDKGISAVWNR